jgi:hypothetical protein
LERIHPLIQHDVVPSEALIDLLKNTLIGSQGTLYQLLDTPTKIVQLKNSHFFSLVRADKLLGTFTICEQEINLLGCTHHSYYIRYVAFDAKFQGGFKKGKSNGGLHRFFKNFFEASTFDSAPTNDGKSIYWAYIDPDNLRSINLNNRLGFEQIGSFKTSVFSRVDPKNKLVERIKSEDKNEVLNLVTSFYDSFQFFTRESLFFDDNYFVLRVNGELVCGIQANPVQWKIKSLPGLSGRILIKIAPYIPRIRKLIQPNNHRFLATEGLFWKDGFEHKLTELLEGVLAITGHHSLLIWSDGEHDFLEKTKINWGFIQKMKKDNSVAIMAKLNGYSQQELADLKKAPKYISGFNVT